MNRLTTASKKTRQHTTRIFLALLLTGTSHVATAEPGEISFGLGMGSLYNGLGINIGYRQPDTFSYLALGCIGLSHSTSSNSASSISDDSGQSSTSEEESQWNGNCGLNVGFLKSGLIGLSSKHAFGFALGATYDDEINRHEQYLGLSYHYFFSDNNMQGWNIGMTPVLRFVDSGTLEHLMLNLGYQF